MVSSGSSKMLEPSSRGDGCVSEPRSEAAVETDRFGFLLANGSASGSGPPPELVRQREAKWIHIISQWDHVLQKKNSKVKEQCLKGIPASLRAKAWPLLCGATQLMKDNTSLYQSLDSRPALQSWVDIIERDLDRQFPFHEMFVSKDSHGQRGLFRVLKAYTQYQPDEGYCQAQGPVAAVLLMNMPAEEAFWCLVQISEQYLPGYYSQLLEGVLFDAAMLSWVLKRACPPAHRHLQRYGVEPLMFATDWLMCLFTRHLPFNTLLRVWDLFFCYGVRVLFQVAVVLVRRVLGRADQRQECLGQMETLERLRGVRESLGLEDDASFMAEVCSVPLSRSDLKRRTEKELETWRKDRPSSTFDPRGRCHGYWASRETLGEERDRRGVNLSAPLVRSASALSLSPSLFRKRWGKRSDAARVERHHSMGVQGVGREGWPNARALRVTRVREEEDGHKAPGNLQSRRDTESTPPTGRRPPQREKEPGENHDSERNTLKGEPGEQVGIGHRTREEQGEQSPGGSGTVQEVIQHHPDLREGAAGGGATQRSAVNLQPRTLKDNNQTQVPVEQDLTDNNQSQVPEEQDLKDNNQSQVPEEQELRDNNQSQVPEEQELTDNNQSQVPEEQELRDNNQSQVPEEQELRDNNQSQVPEEQELRDINQSQVPEEQELRDNNQSQSGETREGDCTMTAILLETTVVPEASGGTRGAAEPLATEEPAVQAFANDKEPVDSSEVTLTPDPSTQQPSGGSEDRGARQRIQDAPLSMGAGPPVSLCIPVSAPLSSQTPTPSGDFRVRKTSHGSRLARRLSEDIFTALETSRFRPDPDPQKGPPAPSRPGLRPPPPGALSALPPPQGPTGWGTSEEPPRRPGFFSRLRGGRPNRHKDTKAERANTQKIQIPKIFLQDFSSGVGEERPLQEPEEQQELLSSRGRRRRRRERELKEREEEKERRRVEKELKKEGRKRDRKAEWPRGKKLTPTSPGSLSGAQHSCSSPHSDSYF
ncbi:unnamed protein product [Gadus morhua 'NCC']